MQIKDLGAKAYEGKAPKETFSNVTAT